MTDNEKDTCRCNLCKICVSPWTNRPGTVGNKDQKFKELVLDLLLCTFWAVTAKGPTTSNAYKLAANKVEEWKKK